MTGESSASTSVEEVLRKKVERQQKQIDLLEKMIEDRAREIFLANEELERRAEELISTERQLVDASRRAGMADVATSVLHNVGNALNSVNVTANYLGGLARGSKSPGLGKAVALLRAQQDPGRFINEDPRGKKIIDYLEGLANQIETDRLKQMEEVVGLEQNIEHIKAIIVAQQNLARGGAITATISVRKKVTDVIKMAHGALSACQVEVSTSYDGLDSDEIVVDRHKVFQILLNLLTNAAHALRPRSSDRRVVLRVFSEGNNVVFEVKDNGVGISTENLTKIFAHGFTTKSEGHGFGLHSCANAAREMNGTLEASSDGPGHGATFTLTLPRTAATSSPSLQAVASA